MQINEMIKSRLNSSPIKLVNPDGESFDEASFNKRYQVVRNGFSNFPANTIIGIKIPKDIDYFICILASLETGHTFIPLDTNYPEERVRQIQDLTDIHYIIDQDFYDSLLASSSSYKKIESWNETAYIICTSGSTGMPKAVEIARSAFGEFINWHKSFFSHVPINSRLLQVTQFTFDISLVDLCFFLNHNCSIYFSKFRSNIFELAYELEINKIQILNTVPNNLSMLLSENVVDRVDLSHLEELLVAGSRFSFGLYSACQKYLNEKSVYNLYGPTEMTIYCIGTKLDLNGNDLSETNVSIGKVFKHLDAKILRDDDSEAQPNENAHLYLAGPQMMTGYKNNLKQTQDAMKSIDGKLYYKSGDIVFKNQSGDIFVTGRSDDTIKYRGFRINLLDIDSYIMTLPYIQDSTTIALPDEESENITCSFLILNKPIEEKSIRKDLESILLNYQIPVKIHFVDSYPLNISGKVCRKTLKKDYIDGKRFYT